MSAPYLLDILTQLTDLVRALANRFPDSPLDVRLHRAFLPEARHERDKVEAHKNVPHAAHVVER